MRSINLTEAEFKALQELLEIQCVYDKLGEMAEREVTPQVKYSECDDEYDIKCREVADKAYLMHHDKYDMSDCGCWALEAMPTTQSDTCDEMFEHVNGREFDYDTEDTDMNPEYDGIYDAFNYLLIKGLRH